MAQTVTVMTAMVAAGPGIKEEQTPLGTLTQPTKAGAGDYLALLHQ